MAAAASRPISMKFCRRGQDKVKQVIRGGGGGRGGGGSGEGGVPKPFMFLVAALALAGIAFYGFIFRVNPDEQGIVLRFGKFDRWEGPGLHFRCRTRSRKCAPRR